MVGVDVVIPVYNNERYLADCLASVKAQTLPPEKVIVVDDGSDEATRDLLHRLAASWARIQVIETEHRGVSHARNLGIATSTAPFVAFLDSDDEWRPEKLERQMAVFAAAGPDVGLVHCSYDHIDETGAIILSDYVRPPTRRGRLFREVLAGTYAVSGSASAAIVRREALDRAGYFDERLYYGEDWDLWIRLADICHFDYTPERLVRIRIHPHSAQRRPDRSKRERFLFQHLIVRDRWYGHPEFPDELRDQYRREIRQIWWSSGALPQVAHRLYKQIMSQGGGFSRSLFHDEKELWRFLLSWLALRLTWWPLWMARRAVRKLARMAGARAA